MKHCISRHAHALCIAACICLYAHNSQMDDETLLEFTGGVSGSIFGGSWTDLARHHGVNFDSKSKNKLLNLILVMILDGLLIDC